MGDPRLPRRVWKKPKRPLNYDLKMSELKTLGEFGLKTKRELWKAHTELSRLRNQARSILALGQDVRQNKEPILIRSLVKVGLVPENSTLDDVLNLQVVDMLSRRLQTIVMKNLGFKTPYQARQAVTHGHIMIGERIVDIPSYVVRVDEEKSIKLVPNSPMKEVLEKIKKEAKEAPPVRDIIRTDRHLLDLLRIWYYSDLKTIIGAAFAASTSGSFHRFWKCACWFGFCGNRFGFFNLCGVGWILVWSVGIDLDSSTSV